MNDLSPLTKEESRIVEAFRRVKAQRHGGLEIAVVNGTLVKLEESVKNDLSEFRGKLREGTS